MGMEEELATWDRDEMGMSLQASVVNDGLRLRYVERSGKDGTHAIEWRNSE